MVVLATKSNVVHGPCWCDMLKLC